MTTTQRPQSPPDERKSLSDAGDILGLAEHFAELPAPLGSAAAFSELSAALRAKAKSDLSAISEDGFAIILSMGIEMLMRCQYFITQRLRQHEEIRDHVNVPIPDDLLRDGWLERAERLSRFVSEMAALRARVRHLNLMSNEYEKGSRQSQRPRLVGGMEARPRQAGGRQSPPASRGQRRATA